jgi:hypothetical protein
MTENDISLEELLTAKEALVTAIVGDMTDAHRRFLVSLERGAPDWGLLGLPRVDKLPAVLWRQQNLDKISRNKRAELVAQLERMLSLDVVTVQLTLIPEKSAPSRKQSRKRDS